MGAITGAQAKIGLKLATTFGTATTCTTGDRLDGVTLDANENATSIQVPVIGSGDLMLNNTDKGNTAPSATISGPAGYSDPKLVAVAQMFGGASFTNMSTYYTHSITFNETANQKYLTLAWQAHSATAGAVEYPSAVCTRAAFNFPVPNDYMGLELDLLGDQYKIASTTNTYSSLDAVTAANSQRIVWQQSDELLINTQSGGALSSPTDRYTVESATLEYSRPQEHRPEAKGSSGNAVPVATGDYPFVVTLTCTFRTLADFTFFTAQQAGTEYKASLTQTGPTLGGSNYKIIHNLPRLKIVESPVSGLTEAGNNNLTVVFTGLVASSAPTGMLNRYPYILINSNRSTSLLA